MLLIDPRESGPCVVIFEFAILPIVPSALSPTPPRFGGRSKGQVEGVPDFIPYFTSPAFFWDDRLFPPPHEFEIHGYRFESFQQYLKQIGHSLKVLPIHIYFILPVTKKESCFGNFVFGFFLQTWLAGKGLSPLDFLSVRYKQSFFVLKLCLKLSQNFNN